MSLSDYGLTPVTQTSFGVGTGNCYEVCVATLTGLPLESMPARREEDAGPLLEWMVEHGWLSLEMPVDALQGLVPTEPYILCGQAEGGGHAVVAAAGRIIHDPNPAAPGVKVPEMIILLIRVSEAPLADAACAT